MANYITDPRISSLRPPHSQLLTLVAFEVWCTNRPAKMGGCMSRKTGCFDPRKDLDDLTGKVVVVTGANTGIGYHTVKFLARKGAKVYLGARNETKALEAITQLEREGLGSGEVLWLNVNLGDPRWAKKAAEDFLRRESRLDILINNAAQLTGHMRKARTYILSTLFPSLLSNATLLSAISAHLCSLAHYFPYNKDLERVYSDVRIITLGSVAHTQSRATNANIRFQTLQDFNHEFGSDFYPDWSRYSELSQVALLM
ncbi:hypothetical protein BDZ97DRAFT_1914683 [Flammula alnicola]|nr:hypothetical protein BDZ97DRAFT_1914683 [Flammula alnicola]